MMKQQDSSNVTKLRRSRNVYEHITSKTADKYNPKSWAFYIRDTQLVGFWIRVEPNGRKSYGCYGRLFGVGNQARVTIGNTDNITASHARKQAVKHLQDIKAGIDPKKAAKEAALNSDRTLEAITKEYVSKRALRETTIRDYLSRLPRNMAMFWKRDIEDITLDDLHKWWKDKGKGKRQALRYLSAVCSFAKRRNYVYTNIASAFRADLGGIKAQEPRTKSIRQHILQAWLHSFAQQSVPHPKYYDETTKTYLEDPSPHNANYCDWNNKPTINETQRDYILFLLLSGKRRNESAKLKWEDLDWSNPSLPTLTLQPETVKGGKADTIPMSDVIGMMMKYRANRSNKHKEFVFENNKNTGHIINPYRSLFKIANYESPNVSIGNPQAKFEDKGNTVYTPHDLRRTLRSVGGNLGYSNLEMKEILAHTKGDQTEGYFVERFYIKEREHLNHIDNSILEDFKWKIMVFWYGADASWLENIDPRTDARPLLPYFDQFNKDQSEATHPNAPYRIA